ncbi:hypothetical protein [Tunturiibacter gelidiferens]|uniref:hypothetical protein n=1 Tax=Tunturiibacter gelidiferens TaxID=3069689 RepID=UPI003D9B1A07
MDQLESPHSVCPSNETVRIKQRRSVTGGVNLLCTVAIVPDRILVSDGFGLRLIYGLPQVYLKDKRRYMDFASIKKIVQSDDLTRNLIDEFVEKGIFYRGYIFQCQNCSDAAWHSISEVDQTFTCRRCGLNQQYKNRHWRIPNEPLWFYKLDEMVYLMLENNGHVPLLTLNKLSVSSQESFLFRPELRITPKSSEEAYLEVDICCIMDGRLCIGEAKSNNSLAGKDLTALQTVERYRDLALRMGVSMVVFSTTENAWNQASRDAIRMAFENHPHIKVMKLTSSSLYS